MKMKNFLIKLIFLGVLFASCGIAKSQKCDRTPEGTSAKKSPPNGNFRLRVVNDPMRYQPGESYNISLERISRPGQAPVAKFTGFYIIAERDPTDDKQAEVANEDLKLGEFEIPPESASLAKISGKCDHLVAHSSSFLKSDIMVYWKAPPVNSGCVVFKATVIVVKDVWYSDDGALSFTFCEDDSESGDLSIPLDKCNACEEAKYELTFEGLWSRHTHPKDYPDNGWLTKFSDIIGASHSINFTLWKYGLPATDGLEYLARQTSTILLEKELKDEGENVRTIIKARGISFPNVTGKTFAVFRVDSKHHLISFVSTLYPSPDWFVGVSGLELCLANGSWVEQKVLNLYPYDAGTDNGPTYISPDQPTIPREAIRRIRPNQPNDPRSPFHDAEGKDMKPLAKLYITRQKLYEMNCEEQNDENEDEDSNVRSNDWNDNGEETNNICATTEWSPWSKCDATCGKGKMTRVRNYVNRKAARQCNVNLVKEKECFVREEDCEDAKQNINENEEEEEQEKEENEDENEDDDNLEDSKDPRCQLTKWSDWSPCSKECGRGTRERSRKYMQKEYHKLCSKMNNAPKLNDQQDCNVNGCSEEKVEKINEDCETTAWSRWSKCSVECGLGEKIKVRIPLKRQPRDENLIQITQLYNKLKSGRRRYADDDEDEDFEDGDDDDESSDFEVMNIANENHPCSNVTLVERDSCNTSRPECENPDFTMPEFCHILPRKGKCKGKEEIRWFYNKNTGSCGIFMYTGCPSNKMSENNFLSEENCIASCARNTEEASSLVDEPIKSHSLIAKVEKIDCKMSPWVHNPCNATCGEGLRWRSRSVLQYPKNGGKSCPRKLVHYERCYRECETPRKMLPLPHSVIQQHHHHQCRYSEWNPWSPCSKSCGDNSVQIRTRTVLNNLNTHLCNERVEERRCEVMPCLVGGGYYNNRNYRF